MPKVTNRFGRSFNRPIERVVLEDLRPGDHILEESIIGLKITFWHHMIVERVDLIRNRIEVIHYYGELKKWPSVCRNTFDRESHTFYRTVYENGECFRLGKVVVRARKRLGETRYCPCFNNCEHFANECKTGEKKCYQLGTSNQFLIKSVIGIIPSLAKWLFPSSGIAKVAENGAKAKFHHLRFPALISVVFEMFLLGVDCSDAITKFEEGKITRRECREIIVKRVCAFIFSLPAFVIGIYIGGGIVPILGAIVGAMVMDFLAKEAAGYFVTPHVIKCIEDLESMMKTVYSIYIQEKKLS